MFVEKIHLISSVIVSSVLCFNCHILCLLFSCPQDKNLGCLRKIWKTIVTIFSNSALCEIVLFALPRASQPTITHCYLLWSGACRNCIRRAPLFSDRASQCGAPVPDKERGKWEQGSDSHGRSLRGYLHPAVPRPGQNHPALLFPGPGQLLPLTQMCRERSDPLGWAVSRS